MGKEIPPITQKQCRPQAPATHFFQNSSCPSRVLCSLWAHADALGRAAVVVVLLLLLWLVLLWTVHPSPPNVAPPGSPQVPLPHALQ